MTSHLQNVDLPDILRVETTQYTGITDIQGEVTMNSITYIGMDVHTTNYTLCAFTLQTQTPFFELQIRPEFEELKKYLTNLDQIQGGGSHFVCGYEAGCLGYSLYKEIMGYQWKGFHVECVIMAPSTMASSPNGKMQKSDSIDARRIARCLCFGQYKSVFVPTEEDEAVKEYIRMRDDTQTMLKQTKQQIIAFCTRHGLAYAGKTYWTQKHLDWLEHLTFSNALFQETLGEYLLTYRKLSENLERYDKRIEELSQSERYAENVSKLCCLKGIATHTAMSLLSEVGDFNRFPSAENFSAFLGLVPRQHSSSNSKHFGAITKTGNSHLRRLLTEAASCYNRGVAGKKSTLLKKRQEGNSPEVIAYADRGSERLRRKYIHLVLNNKKPSNIAKIAVARELACFIWGMMTDHIT